MIDTVKIAIYKQCNKEFYNILLSQSEQKKSGLFVRSTTGITERKEAFVMKVNNFDSYEQLIINGSLKTPSHFYHIHWRCYEDRITFEFSLPKFIYGTNSIELHSHLKKNFNVMPYDLLQIGIRSFFNSIFPLIRINYGGVELLRVDFCYNQLYQSKEESLKALRYIKLKHQGRADRLNFEYGYIELSKSNYFKIYHKGEEFRKHDFNKLKDEATAINYQNFSDKILRYEKKCTPSNWSYQYNLKIKMKGQHSLIREYYDSKNNKEYIISKDLKTGKNIIGVKRVTKEQRQLFEKKQRFTLGNSKIYGAIKLHEFYFNYMYRSFRNDIKKRYSIGKMSLKTLHKEVIDNDKNKTMNVRILAYIKVFKSLKRAQESGAFSKRTLSRYEKYMKEKNLSTTKVSNNIYQCWTHHNYYSHLRKHNITPFKLTKNLQKFRFHF